MVRAVGRAKRRKSSTRESRRSTSARMIRVSESISPAGAAPSVRALRSSRASWREMEFKGFRTSWARPEAKVPEGGHLLALDDSRVGVPKLTKCLALGLAVSSGLDPQRDLMADRLQETQLTVVEARWLARSHVEHSPAPPLEAQGDAGVGDGSLPGPREVGHPRALGRVVGEHAADR